MYEKGRERVLDAILEAVVVVYEGSKTMMKGRRKQGRCSGSGCCWLSGSFVLAL